MKSTDNVYKYAKEKLFLMAIKQSLKQCSPTWHKDDKKNKV
jgi:hypothetical protein